MAKLKETTVRENLYVKGDVYVWDFELGQYKLLFAPATETTLGGIIVGNNLTIDAKGVLNSTRQPVDKELSLLSANPVENQTITRALNLKVDTALASSAATATNQLMDRESVQTLITTNNAVFRGSFDTWALVPIDSEKYLPDEEGNKEPKKNDYMIVNDAGDYHEGGVSGKEGTWRFIYIGNWRTEGKLGWQPQYKMSDSFTPAQKAALNSNITAQKVEKYDAYDAQIQNRSLLGHTHPAAQVDGLKPIATSGEYRDLYNVPTSGNTSTPIYFGTDPTTKTGRPYSCNFAVNAAGGSSTPIYFKTDSDGIARPYACGFSVNTTVPANAIFTDQNVLTTNSAGTFYLAGKNTTSTNIGSLLVNSSIYVNGNSLYAPYFVGTISGNADLGKICDLVYGTMGPTDYFRIRLGDTGQDNGYVEIATGDNGTEPIYVRQYDTSSIITNSATLLDGNGNTSFPKTVTASSFNASTISASSSITAPSFNGGTFIGTIVPVVVNGDPSTSSNNGWYYVSSKTINGQGGAWFIQKIGNSSYSLFIAYSCSDARIVFQKINNGSWYSSYAYWHA